MILLIAFRKFILLPATNGSIPLIEFPNSGSLLLSVCPVDNPTGPLLQNLGDGVELVHH